MAHYSSLFTLGLLSDRATPPPSPDKNIFFKFRKSSLPTSSLSKPSDISTPSDPFHHPPQFTNPFANSPEAATELRSFLSLDLAADQSLTSRRLNSIFVPESPDLPTNRAPKQPSSGLIGSPSLPPPRRASRDSLRTLPSPRPAPSSALPQVPRERKEPHFLPPILIPSPSLFTLSPASSAKLPGGSSPPSHRTPLSAPPGRSRSSLDSSSSFIQTPSPVSPLSSPSFRSSRHASFLSFSSTASVRTSRRRVMERSDALACLEGRSRAPGRIPRSARQRNFMSMSDDEDEEARDEDDAGGDADIEDDSDVPERSSRTTFRPSFVLSEIPQGHLTDIPTVSRCPFDEEEDRVLPSTTIPSHPQSPQSNPRSRSRRSTLESWFPLANFIDLKDGELQGFHGLVEIVNGL
ncbi:hypothetical protein F5148DRAFT_1148063 [Russula earlei]|uniref:Uncharacterized protein n=1 Tax=Russula earlei TaxID=71964 RepID=A0ACC0UDT9_9AGAM|nr:hypothetical protein F5148DRAFT_1148063 [Russula earlei]